MDKELIAKYEELVDYMNNFIDKDSMAGNMVRKKIKEISLLKQTAKEGKEDILHILDLYQINCQMTFHEGTVPDAREWYAKNFNQSKEVSSSRHQEGDELFKKVYIKRESDLPKEEGRYLVGVKDNLEPQDVFWWLTNTQQEGQTEYWLNTFDWYLLPIKEVQPSEGDIVSVIKNRYIAAHCNPDFKGDKFKYIFNELPVTETKPDPSEVVEGFRETLKYELKSTIEKLEQIDDPYEEGRKEVIEYALEMLNKHEMLNRRYASQLPKVTDELLSQIRNAFADYTFSEGCSCCRDIEKHTLNSERLARLLNVPAYSDNSGYDFSQFRTEQ